MEVSKKRALVDEPELLGAQPWTQIILGVPFGLFAASVAGITQVGFAYGIQGATTWQQALATTWPGQPIGMMLQIVAAIAVMTFVVKCLARRPVYELERRGAFREFSYGALVGVGVVAAAVALLFLLGSYSTTGIVVGRGLLSGLFLGLGSAFGEEVVMRGILLRVLIGKIGTMPALILTSMTFGLLHLGNPGVSIVNTIGIALQAGFLFGSAYLLTRRLWLVIGMHAAWNFTQTAVFGLNVSGVPTEPGLFIAEVQGPDWLTGGRIGIEGSALMIVLGVIVSALLLRASRRTQIRPFH